MDDATKIELSRRTAKTLFMTMQAASIPEEVQIEAAILLLKSMFMGQVKPEHRISLFNSVVIKVRKELQEHLKGASNGKA